MGNGELNSMSAAVREVIDAYPDGHEFYGNQLKDDVVKLYPDAINMYPDTILRMARRHRRYAFCVVDQNNSLYKKLDVEPFVEEIKEAAPKEDVPEEQPEYSQGELFPNYVFFLVVFFVFGFEVVFSAGTAGRPLLSHSFKNSISSSLSSNIAFTPIYRDGSYPCLFNLFRVASEETTAFGELRRYAISPIVNSIYSSIYRRNTLNQVKNVKMSVVWTYLLYRRIVNPQKFMFFLKIFCQNLDNLSARVDNVYMS